MLIIFIGFYFFTSCIINSYPPSNKTSWYLNLKGVIPISAARTSFFFILATIHLPSSHPTKSVLALVRQVYTGGMEGQALGWPHGG